MSRKLVPLLAATFLSIGWTSGAAAATPEKDGSAALHSSAAAVAYAAQKGPNSSQCKKDPGLFNRLGGFFGIAAVVNNFSDAILQNPVLNANPEIAEWNAQEAPARLAGLKFLRTMWIAAMVGGPIKYTGEPLSEAHDRFDFTPAQFAAVGAEIVEALQEAGVAQADIDQLVCIYQTSMDDVVSASQGPREVKPPR